MLNNSIKVTKKVIIINQKYYIIISIWTDIISEKTNIINREPLKNSLEMKKIE